MGKKLMIYIYLHLFFPKFHQEQLRDPGSSVEPKQDK